MDLVDERQTQVLHAVDQDMPNKYAAAPMAALNTLLDPVANRD